MLAGRQVSLDCRTFDAIDPFDRRPSSINVRTTVMARRGKMVAEGPEDRWSFEEVTVPFYLGSEGWFLNLNSVYTSRNNDNRCAPLYWLGRDGSSLPQRCLPQPALFATMCKLESNGERTRQFATNKPMQRSGEVGCSSMENRTSPPADR